MKKIQLRTGEFAMVDDEDFDRLMKHQWRLLEPNGTSRYASSHVYVDGEQELLLMRRVVMNARKGEYVDHRNHDGLDNQKKNLRVCSNAQNSRNSRKRAAKTTSKHKGVIKDGRGYWRAKLVFNGDAHHLGHFKTEDMAGVAYNIKARELDPDFFILNEIENEAELIPLVMEEQGNPKKRAGGSKYRGVCRCPKRRQWRATKKRRHVGYFSTEEAARDAYLAFFEILEENQKAA